MDQSGDTVNGADKRTDPEQDAQQLPQVAAAFLVKFDNRKGYTLAWHRAIDGLDIEGVVEFKCLPSGLHNVKEDLVYFTYEQYAGVSAFLNRQDDSDARNARMLAIGVMVPIESGRLGKSWLYAESLKELTKKQIEAQDDYKSLENFWEEHRISPESQQDESEGNASQTKQDLNINIPQKPLGYRTSRAMSVGTIPLKAGHMLPPHHPALSLSDLLHTFGPLIFPLYRSALLRKRILVLGEAPVERSCNFIYNLSILSSLPRQVASYLPLDDTADLRLQPLFNIGINDIDSLPDGDSGQGWIACTTDDVLCTKPELFDLLVILPNTRYHDSPRRFPKLVASSPELSRAHPKVGVRASQRDARRYATLLKGLQRIPASSAVPPEEAITDEEESGEVDNADTVSIASTASSTFSRTSIIEPQSWSRIAYTSLIWWASAGDKRAGLTEAEENQVDDDATLLDLHNPDDETSEDNESPESRTKEVAIVAYFHRLSGLIFGVLDNAAGKTMDSNAEETEERYTDDVNEEDQNTNPASNQGEEQQRLVPKQTKGDEQEDDSPVEITQQDVSDMGLDVWSSGDQKFVEEMVSFWWNREAVVQGGKIECCGVRLI